MFISSSYLWRCRLTAVAAFTALILTACGGSEPPATAEATAAVARIEVEPAALLLTDQGQSQAMVARAFDVEGREILGAIVTWRASRPTQVAVAADGLVTAQVALGSGQIVAEARGVRSAPVLVSVARPAPGVLLINDSQLVGSPAAVDPGAEPSIDNAYEVLLTGIEPPAIGTLLLGREGRTVGGEVLQSQREGSAVRVRLRMVPVGRLMQSAQIDEDIDLTGLPLKVPPELEALYSVEKVDGEYVFTPRPGAATATMVTKLSARRLGLFARKLGPFTCELALPELPVSLAQPAQFSLKFEPHYIVQYDSEQGLRKLMLTADTAFKLKANLQLSAAALVNVTCEVFPYKRLQPLPGWAGLVLAGELQAGVGFELEGSLNIPLLGAELIAESKGPLQAGLDCEAGTCKTVGRWDLITSNTLRLSSPADALANTRSELFLFGYGIAKTKAGLTLVDEARVDAITARGGLKFETSLAPEVTQLAPLAVGVPDYRADYKLGLLAEVAAGSVNKGGSALRTLLQKLGVFKVTLLKTQVSEPLAVSPKGTVSVDRSVFRDGDPLQFKVQIDPQTAEFSRLGYNLRRIRVLLTADGRPPREVASVEAKPGQTSFDLSWVAEGTTGQSQMAFFAFVDTVLPMPVGLELGKAILKPQIFAGRFEVSYDRVEDNESTLPDFPQFPDFSRRRVTDAIRLSGLAVQEAVGQPGFRLSGVVGTRTRDDQGSVLRLLPFPDCTGPETKIETAFLRQATVPGARGSLSMPIEGPEWRLQIMDLSDAFTGKQDRISARVMSQPVGSGCASRGLVDGSSSTTTNSSVGVRLPLPREPVEAITGIWLRGPIGVDASTGRRAIKASLTGTGPVFNQTVPVRFGFLNGIAKGQVQRSYTVNLDLVEGPSPEVADLTLRLDARPFAERLGFMTYAVNLVNNGTLAATDVRAEFTLPAGWTLVGTTGWSGCSASGRSVVCRVDTLAVAEQRALLVDVQAPDAGGSHTAHARVLAAEGDANLADNSAQLVTQILE